MKILREYDSVIEFEPAREGSLAGRRLIFERFSNGQLFLEDRRPGDDRTGGNTFVFSPEEAAALREFLNSEAL